MLAVPLLTVVAVVRCETYSESNTCLRQSETVRQCCDEALTTRTTAPALFALRIQLQHKYYM